MAKILLPNQCTPLHFIYGKDDCCLCRAETRIKELEEEVKELKNKVSGKPIKEARLEEERSMTRQEEIKSGILKILVNVRHRSENLGMVMTRKRVVEEIMEFLHSQGLVILKTGQEFPDSVLVSSATEPLIKPT